MRISALTCGVDAVVHSGLIVVSPGASADGPPRLQGAAHRLPDAQGLPRAPGGPASPAGRAAARGEGRSLPHLEMLRLTIPMVNSDYAKLGSMALS